MLVPAYKLTDLAHWETDEEYEQAQEAVLNEAQRLGREAGENLDLLDGIWPELFGPDAHQATWFGEGLAESIVDVPRAWSKLLDRFQTTDEERRNPSLLCGFLRAAGKKDEASVSGFLNDALRDPLLGPVSPVLQIAVGVDDAGIRRLVTSIEAGAASARTYCNLMPGQPTGGIPPADLSRIVLGVTSLPDGYGAAVEILSMHFHGQRNHQAPWDPSLVHCGRRLLLSFPFDQPLQLVDYRLATIARVCLQGNESAEDARLICRRIVDASAERLIPASSPMR